MAFNILSSVLNLFKSDFKALSFDELVSKVVESGQVLNISKDPMGNAAKKLLTTLSRNLIGKHGKTAAASLGDILEKKFSLDALHSGEVLFSYKSHKDKNEYKLEFTDRKLNKFVTIRIFQSA